MENYYFFGAGNTCQGFKNHFEGIAPEENSFTYILKGGAGCGKSTFMKKVGEYFYNKGYTIEYFFCSSDSSSLDGVRIVEKNISIVDGTSPHTCDTKIAGVKDKIINLGEFISPNIKQSQEQIEQNLFLKSQCYKIAYSYLSSINNLLNIEKLQKVNVVEIEKDFNTLLKELDIKKIRKNKTNKKQGERGLFLNSIEKDGITSLIAKNKFNKIITLNYNNSYFYNLEVISLLMEKLNKENVDYIKFYSLLDSSKIESILILSTKTLITVDNSKENFKLSQIIFKLLLEAGKYIDKAKYYHKKVESFYTPNMDFTEINKTILKTIQEIE